jgi:hypothetical protein
MPRTDYLQDARSAAELFAFVRAFDRKSNLSRLLAGVHLKHEPDILSFGSFHHNEFECKPNSAYLTTYAAIPDSIRVTDAVRDRICPLR